MSINLNTPVVVSLVSVHLKIHLSAASKAGQDGAIFRQTLQQKRLWVLKISIFPLNYSQTESFQPQILYFEQKIFERKFFDNTEFREGQYYPLPSLLPPSPSRCGHDATNAC